MTPDDYAAPAEIAQAEPRSHPPAEEIQIDDSTLATKGLIAGICLSIPLWALLAAAVWAVV